jgi:hypothetical protein
LRRLTWKELRDVCKLAGYGDPRIEGDHLTMSRDGSNRPVVIKMVRDLGNDIIQSNKRTMGLTTNEFEDLVSQVRGQKKKRKK